jgi:hypothetical protein
MSQGVLEEGKSERVEQGAFVGVESSSGLPDADGLNFVVAYTYVVLVEKESGGVDTLLWLRGVSVSRSLAINSIGGVAYLYN